MGYQQAIKNAWDDVSGIPEGGKTYAVKLLSDTYTIDLKNKSVMSDSCNVPAKEHITIIILHYLAKKLKLNVLPAPSGEWVDFKELEGGEGYYPAFKKRTIDKVLKKYGADPDALLEIPGRIPSQKVESHETGIIIKALESVPILITISKADEEFGADANILFDRTISSIFCTEDIVVLTEILTHSL